MLLMVAEVQCLDKEQSDTLILKRQSKWKEITLRIKDFDYQLGFQLPASWHCSYTIKREVFREILINRLHTPDIFIVSKTHCEGGSFNLPQGNVVDDPLTARKLQLKVSLN